MTRPRLLDLFCGAGGAAMGYHRAGFDVVGVDIKPQPHYPFEFIQRDALEYLDFVASLKNRRQRRALGYDAIHASPPCQGYLNLRRVNQALYRDDDHELLIEPVRDRLRSIGLPFVIENVPDARPFMDSPVLLCGSSFGLGVRRHRLFESSVPMLLVPPCAHHTQSEPKYWTSWRPNGEKRLATVVQVYGNGGRADEWADAMGIDWMPNPQLREAIPPAYTEWIGTQLLASLKAAA